MQLALGTVTLLALLMTIAMGFVTWRLVHEERRRSAARLAALAAELKSRGVLSGPSSSQFAAETAEPADIAMSPAEQQAEAPAELFGQPPQYTGGWVHRLTGVGAAGALLAVLVSVAIFAVSGDGNEEQEAAQLERERVPVELLTLAHERQDGMLAISGTVRNPEDGLDEHQLSVMAMAFDDDGSMVASGRTQVAAETLPAGAESSFTISLPAKQASRYRISFLVDETTVPHLDRRTSQALEETES